MNAIDRSIWRCVDALILLAVLGMVVLITMQVGSRFFRQSIPWTEELSRLLFIWTIWMGIAASFRTGTHPAITFIPGMMPAGLRGFFRILPVVATLILFGAVSWFGYALLQQQIRFGEQSPILQIGMWWSTLPLILGSAFAMVGVIIDGFIRDPLADPVEEEIAKADGAQA